MKTLKIYGVYDLMEWRAIIPCKNGVRLHIMFEGGSASTNGTVPAKYRTDNEVVQALIETSDLYKKGRIKLVRTIQVAQPVAVSSSSHVVAKEKVVAKRTKASVGEKSSTTVVSAPTGDESPKELKEVKVSDIEGEGRKYLVDNFSADVHLLTGVNAIIAQAAAYGIKFVTE